MPVPVLDKRGEMLTTKFPWNSVFAIHSGCCYATWMWPCAVSEISEWHLNQVIERKYSLGGQFQSCIATVFFPISACACPRYIQCCYWTDLAEALALKMGKDMTTFGPCGEFELFGAYMTFYGCLPFCTGGCLGGYLGLTSCMLYGEVIDAKRRGNGAPNVDAMFAKMGDVMIR